MGAFRMRWKLGVRKFYRLNQLYSYFYNLGLTLDYNTCEKLHYEEFKKRCLAFGGEPEETDMYINYESTFRPNLKDGEVYNVPLTKLFRPVIRKGILGEDHKIFEFGYVRD